VIPLALAILRGFVIRPGRDGHAEALMNGRPARIEGFRSGCIKAYRQDAGFGFIAPDNGNDLFFHICCCRGWEFEPMAGDLVRFKTGRCDRTGKLRADVVELVRLR
jgi:cold shock CspA family protein